MLLANALQIVLHTEICLNTAAAEGTAQSCATDASSSRSSFAADTRSVSSVVDSSWYVKGVRLAIREGGCCASRASYVGACLGAMLSPADGASLIPEDWVRRCAVYAQVAEDARAICTARSGHLLNDKSA